MNGRLYDPVNSRFFSPDPYVQMPDFTQNFNRYSFKNIDLPATHYFTSKHHGTNTVPIERASSYEDTRLGMKRRVDNPISTPSGRYYDGQSLPPQERSIWIGNAKGRTDLIYSGFVEEGFNAYISFDGNHILTLGPGNYSSTTISIPSGTKYVNIRLDGNHIYSGTTYPFRVRIAGIPK